MKAIKLIIMTALSLSMLTACGKKDSNFAAKYANPNGAGAGNAANATVSDQAVDSVGIKIDILSVDTSATNKVSLSAGPMTFTAMILVGNQYRSVSTTINSSGAPVQGSTTIGSYAVNVTAMCGNLDCDPYYIQVDSYLNGQPKIQTGYMFKRFEAQTSDRYTRFPAPFKAFPDMVTYLNTLN